MFVTSSQLWLISLVESVLVNVLSRCVFAMDNTLLHSTAILNPKLYHLCKKLPFRDILNDMW